MENVANGKFDDDTQRLRNAEFNAGQLLTFIKNRYINKRLILKVWPKHLREYILERLPEVRYVDIKPPNLFERVRRRFAD
jgi:hypothetical protein